MPHLEAHDIVHAQFRVTNTQQWSNLSAHLLQGTRSSMWDEGPFLLDNDDNSATDGPVFIEDWTNWAEGERQEVHASGGADGNNNVDREEG